MLATDAVRARSWCEEEIDDVLGAFGLFTVPSREVVGPWEARSAAATLGWPVALRFGSASACT